MPGKTKRVLFILRFIYFFFIKNFKVCLFFIKYIYITKKNKDNNEDKCQDLWILKNLKDVVFPHSMKEEKS